MNNAQELFAKYGLSPRLPEQFDHQVTGTFGECERMAYYVHILGRRKLQEDRTALNWGKTFHSAAEVWEVTANSDAVISAIDSGLDENIEDRYGRTKGRMFEAFLKYHEFCQTNPIEILRTEQPTALRCDSGESCPYFANGCGLEYGGRLDNIIRWQGMVGPRDRKTTVMDDSDPIAEYRPSHQFMGYVWVVSHLMAQHSWGIIVDRVVTNKSKIDIKRFPVSFSVDQIREWVENERTMQERLVHLFNNHPFDETKWRQNYFRCAKPWPCAFRDACLASRDMGFRYKWLQQHTEERRWDFRNPDAMDAEGAEKPLVPIREAFENLLIKAL